jgi:magnesium chelatase family protein
MSVATTASIALRGAIGHRIEVQVDVSPGLVATTMVGRVDSALNEGRDRVRMAIINSNLEWPSTRRVTVLLSPADLPKSGSHFDLAVAVAVLGTMGLVDAEALPGVVFIGELSLDGGLRSVHGVLPMAMAAARSGAHTVIVPEPCEAEAAMVSGISVIGLRSLGQVVAHLNNALMPDAPPVPAIAGQRFLEWRGSERLEDTDLADLVGMRDSRFAIEVAAAGGHHLLLSGPKGCGKTSLAERISGILPPLGSDEAIELTAVRSLAGLLDPAMGLETAAPFLAPHHDASKASIIGGGSGRVRPGSVSLAHGGVLFLDEFPLFRSDVIQSLREPLESGDITVARGDETVTLPARCLVVLAANPCPCGNYHPQIRDKCTCRATERRDYQERVSGPVADRIDIVRHLLPYSAQPADSLLPTESSDDVRSRVADARSRQASRFRDVSWRLNAHAPGAALRRSWPLSDAGMDIVDRAVLAGSLTRRGSVRVHRLAWTLADLLELAGPDASCVDTAVRLRNGDSLLAATLARGA